MLFHELDDPSLLPRGKPSTMARLRYRGGAVEAQKLVGQHPAKCFSIETAGRMVVADLGLELGDGLPKAEVIEQHPGLKIYLIEAAIGMDSV